MRDDSTRLTHNLNTPQTKTCIICGSEHFLSRQTCSKECLGEFRSQIQKVTIDYQKTCEFCGNTFTHMAKENIWKFSIRKTCSIECGHSLAGKLKKDNLALPPKECKICKVMFERRDNERRKEFVARKTCSQECAKQIMRSENWSPRTKVKKKVYPTTPKPCVICEKIMTIKENRDNERPCDFAKRQTCSEPCRQILIYKNGRSRSSNSPYPIEWTPEFRASIRKRDGDKCAFCESRDALHVHHINYQKFDCRPINLLTLCQSCHMKTNRWDRSDWFFKCQAILVERGIVDLEDIAA